MLLTKFSSKLTSLRVLLQPIYSMTRIQSYSENKPPQNPNEVPCIDVEEFTELPIPEYPFKDNEPLETQRARLLYQSRKRGMLENDILLSTFAAKYLNGMNADQVHLYDRLINGPSNDWDIYYWATETKPLPDEYNTEIMTMLKKHIKNELKESRFRQPSL